MIKTNLSAEAVEQELDSYCTSNESNTRKGDVQGLVHSGFVLRFLLRVLFDNHGSICFVHLLDLHGLSAVRQLKITLDSST